MQILVTGPGQMLAEFQNRYGEKEVLQYFPDADIPATALAKAAAVIDFWIDEQPERVEEYLALESLVVLCNIPKYSLAEFEYQFGAPSCTLIGFNGLPGFIDRPLLEVSLRQAEDKELLEKVCASLGAEFRVVADRVGMATPRVICQIINEAYYTVQEGTATREDIDLGMQLGTNYPHGPFAWSQLIGLDHVYELLEAVWRDTGDERYKICPLLKREYLLLGAK